MKGNVKRKIVVPRFEVDKGFQTTPERSRQMSRIKGVETKPEIALRKAIWAKGIRFRKNYKLLPGKPDIYLPKYGIVIFVDGEFWHGYDWSEKKKKIKSNRKFWIPKIERNIQRDEENNLKLKELGYVVIRFWEHEIKKNLDKCVKRVFSKLKID